MNFNYFLQLCFCSWCQIQSLLEAIFIEIASIFSVVYLVLNISCHLFMCYVFVLLLGLNVIISVIFFFLGIIFSIFCETFEILICYFFILLFSLDVIFALFFFESSNFSFLELFLNSVTSIISSIFSFNSSNYSFLDLFLVGLSSLFATLCFIDFSNYSFLDLFLVGLSSLFVKNDFSQKISLEMYPPLWSGKESYSILYLVFDSLFPELFNNLGFNICDLEFPGFGALNPRYLIGLCEYKSMYSFFDILLISLNLVSFKVSTPEMLYFEVLLGITTLKFSFFDLTVLSLYLFFIDFIEPPIRYISVELLILGILLYTIYSYFFGYFLVGLNFIYHYIPLSFQQPSSSAMEVLIEVYNFVMYFLIFIGFFVVFLLYRILSLYYTQFYRSKVHSNLKNFLVSRRALLIFKQFKHLGVLEFIWTLLPSIILFIISIPSFLLLFELDELLEPEITIKVIGHQWYWSYEGGILKVQENELVFSKFSFDSYMISEDDLADGQFRLLSVDNPIYLPTFTRIRLLVTADDVLHSWAVPSLGVKIDAVPGRLNQAPIYIIREGIFFGQCSEICGVNHGFMPIEVHAVSLHKYISLILSKEFLSFFLKD
jgi:cytochrome c oxidase subunit 2